MSEQNNKMQENKMGTMPVNRLLLGMSLPMMISMIVQALYNIVDSIFVSKVSEDALTAVSMAFPLQMLVIAVGAGTGVGINAVLSKALGEKNQERVNKAATNGIFLSVMSYLLFVVVGIFIVKPFFNLQTTDNTIINYGVSYLTICCTCSIGVFMQFVFERLLQSTGKTFYTMITQIIGAGVNLILDPILIFGLFGVPRMGVAGAAIATVIGQVMAAVAAMIFNIKFNKEVQISFRAFRPDGKIIGHIYAVGLPSIIMQSIGSVMNYGMNQILYGFTKTAVSIFGVYFKLQSFILMPIFGLTNGLIPIVAYNFGAGKRKRMIKAAKLSVLYAELILLVGFAIFQLFPDKLLLMFDASDYMLSIGVPALRTISIHFLIAGYCIVCGSMFQALGHGMCSMWVSICRQLIALLPAAFLFSRLGRLELVWWAFPIAEMTSFIMSTIFMVMVYRKTIRKVPLGD